MNCHPLAALFPLMEGKAFQELCEDIKAHEQINPITVQGNLILDGRNRARACEKLGKPVKQVQFDSLNLNVSPEEFIWSNNGPRRNLTSDQKAAIQMEFAEAVAEEGRRAKVEGGKTAGRSRPQKDLNECSKPIAPPPKHITREKLAKQAGISERKIQEAALVSKVAPDLLPEVRAGNITLPQAIRQAEGRTEPTKRKAIIENAAKNKMVTVLSGIRGMCRGLAEINMPALCEACTGDEAVTWAKSARESARNLRVFASLLEQKGNGESETDN
jgi:hypothetical protein